MMMNDEKMKYCSVVVWWKRVLCALIWDFKVSSVSFFILFLQVEDITLSTCPLVLHVYAPCCITSDVLHMQWILLCGINKIVGSLDRYAPLPTPSRSFSAPCRWQLIDGSLMKVSWGQCQRALDSRLQWYLCFRRWGGWTTCLEYVVRKWVIFLWIHIIYFHSIFLF